MAKKKMTAVEAKDAITNIAAGTKEFQYKDETLRFRKLTLPEANKVQEVYSKELARLTMEGDLPNQSMVDMIVLKKAKQMGIDPKLLDPGVQQRWFQKIYRMIPEMFESEKEEERKEALESKAKDIAEVLSEEEIEELLKLNAVLGLRNELLAHTAEAQAQKIRMKQELVFAVERLDGTPRWKSVEELDKEGNDDITALIDQYREFVRGRGKDFLLDWLSPGSGSDSGTSQEETEAKSSGGRRSTGRKSKKT